MDFQFSRFNMYVQRPGVYSFEMSPAQYNLPGNLPQTCQFEIHSSGFQDELRPADCLILGGSVAFGIGAPGPRSSTSGHLKARGISVINAAIPGYTSPLDVITLIKIVDQVRPKQVVFLHGTNDLAMAFGNDYHGNFIDPNPQAFYDELNYRALVDEYFQKDSLLPTALRWSQRRIREQFPILQWLIAPVLFLRRLFSRCKSKLPQGTATPLPLHTDNADARAAKVFEQYSLWMGVARAICQARKIKIIVAIQPYYSLGRELTELQAQNFFRINRSFDEMIERYLPQLAETAEKIEGLHVLRLDEEFKKVDAGVFTDPVHLNERGCTIAAEAIAKALR